MTEYDKVGWQLQGEDSSKVGSRSCFRTRVHSKYHQSLILNKIMCGSTKELQEVEILVKLTIGLHWSL